MVRAVRQGCALAGATLLEGMQQPAALLLLLTAVVLTALTPVFQFHTLGEEGRLARDSGLAFQLVFGLVLAAVSASSSLSAEIERGTAAATLCKPVSRPLFLLGKFGGVMGLVTIFWGGVLMATLLAERASEHFALAGEEAGSRPDWITMTLSVLAPAAALGVAGLLNFWRRARFGVAAFLGVPAALLVVLLACGCYNQFGHLAGYQPDLNGRVPAAAILIWLALAMFAALASALATRLRSGATLVVCLLLLAAGLTGDAWGASAAPCSWRGILGGLAPNWQHFWMCDALADQGRIAWGYVAEAAMYAGAWSALALGCGFLALRHRDLG